MFGRAQKHEGEGEEKRKKKKKKKRRREEEEEGDQEKRYGTLDFVWITWICKALYD